MGISLESRRILRVLDCCLEGCDMRVTPLISTLVFGSILTGGAATLSAQNGFTLADDREAITFGVDSFAIMDLTAGYKLSSTGATLQLSVNNVFDTGYRSFVGVPRIGRFAMARVRYEIF
jgi:outer membrane receptor protein involved in Fe transport